MVKRHHGFWTRAMKYLALAAIAVLLVPALLPKRWLYRHGRPNRLARLLNRGWVIAHSAGLWPSRFVTLEVPGRRTGADRAPILVGGAWGSAAHPGRSPCPRGRLRPDRGADSCVSRGDRSASPRTWGLSIAGSNPNVRSGPCGGREQRQAKVTDLREQAVQRRLVGDGPGDDGRAAGFAGELQPVEPGRPALVEEALDVDLVPRRFLTSFGVHTSRHQQVGDRATTPRAPLRLAS